MVADSGQISFRRDPFLEKIDKMQDHLDSLLRYVGSGSKKTSQPREQVSASASTSDEGYGIFTLPSDGGDSMQVGGRTSDASDVSDHILPSPISEYADNSGHFTFDKYKSRGRGYAINYSNSSSPRVSAGDPVSIVTPNVTNHSSDDVIPLRTVSDAYSTSVSISLPAPVLNDSVTSSTLLAPSFFTPSASRVSISRAPSQSSLTFSSTNPVLTPKVQPSASTPVIAPISDISPVMNRMTSTPISRPRSVRFSNTPNFSRPSSEHTIPLSSSSLNCPSSSFSRSFSNMDKSVLSAQSFIKRCSSVFPKFDPEQDDTSVWWNICEKIFSTNNIHDDAVKFQMILCTFGKDHLKALDPFLAVGDTSKQYSNLRKGIQKLYSLTNRERLEKVISTTYDGRELPSVLMHNIKLGLGKNVMSEEALRSIFLNKLTPFMRSQLAVYNSLPEDEFLNYADQIFLSNRQTDSNTEKAVDKKDTDTNSATNLLIFQAISQLQNKVSEMSVNLEETKRAHFYNASRASGPVFDNHPSQVSAPSYPGPLCFYHTRFAANAKFCVPPCAWGGHPLPLPPQKWSAQKN